MYFATALLMLGVACKKKEEPVKPSAGFTVKIENVSEPKAYFQTGVFNTPVGDSSPGPATPGKSYQFSFNAGKGHYLSFATMFVQSNDLFFAPADSGIKLFDDNGMPVTGDVTAQIYLWDAGTEVNQEPGVGPDQAPRQSGPDTGMAENGTIKMIADVMDGFNYPAVDQVIKATLTYDGDNSFTLKIENISGGNTLETPLAPGVWLVHDNTGKLFEAGSMASTGLERIAEDGDPGMMNSNLAANAGYVSPFAPGVFVVAPAGSAPLFMQGQADAGLGLEALAEDGDPSGLATALSSMQGVVASGVFNTPDGASAAGPLMPGASYSFEFTASEGDNLNFATMLVQSNDLFFAFDDSGLPLFNQGQPVSGDMTMQVSLWDAGTEVNEFPGAGMNQPLRQAGANTGPDENGTVDKVNDNYTYPEVSAMIKVTITAN